MSSHAAIPNDTSPDAAEMQLNILRQKSPAQRVALAINLTSEVIQASKRAIRRHHPEFTDRQVMHMFVELHYGKALADEVRQYQAARDHG
jgi:hypothetical protein